MIELVLPWPPSVNHYWAHVRGRAYITEQGRAFRDAVIWECRAKRIRKIPGKLGVTIRACPPDARRRDLDNLNKAPLDALQHAGVYADDSQIDDLRIYRGPVLKGGALHVQIAKLSHFANSESA